MQQTIILILLVIFIASAGSVPVATRQNDKKPFTFDDIFAGRFYFGGFNGSWISDDEILFRRGDLNKYRISDGNVEVFLESSVYNNWRSPSFAYSTDYTQLLVRFNATNVFRHSIVAQYDIYNIADRSITNIGGGEPLNFCVLSPNGNLVAFVRDNNVFMQTIGDNEIQLTDDGVNGVVYNGVPDWVYEGCIYGSSQQGNMNIRFNWKEKCFTEEVLGSRGALWFSSNGNKIAIASFDDTEVEEFTYVLYEDQNEKEESLRYPKAGRVNPNVTFRYIDVTDPSLTWHTFPAPTEIVTNQICDATGVGSCYEVPFHDGGSASNFGLSLNTCTVKRFCQ